MTGLAATIRTEFGEGICQSVLQDSVSGIPGLRFSMSAGYGGSHQNTSVFSGIYEMKPTFDSGRRSLFIIQISGDWCVSFANHKYPFLRSSIRMVCIDMVIVFLSEGVERSFSTI